MERREEAFADFERGLAIDSRHPVLLFNRALLLAEAGRKGEAIEAWEAYLDKAGSMIEQAQDAAEARKRLRQLKREAAKP
jgi:tetratricopeptide (TPR) repeat protein